LKPSQRAQDPGKFPFAEGGKDGEAFVLGYFARLAQHPEISQVWKNLKTLVQVHLTQPEFWAVIDTRDGKTMKVTTGKANQTPELTLTIAADDFHRIYSGQLNVLSAFASQKVLAEGKVSVIMETTWTLPQAIEIYRGHCQELGLPLGKTEPAAVLAEPAPEESGSRTERLRLRFAAATREVCIERARLFTESFQHSEGKLQVLRQAEAFAHVMNHLPVHIYPDELIVGNITSKFLGAGVYPEGAAGRVVGELDTIGSRATNPFNLNDADKGELREHIFPYWKGRTLESRARQLWPPEVVRAFERIGIFILTEVAGIGHILLNHSDVLRRGLNVIAAEAEKQATKFRKQGNKHAASFCQAAKTSCDAVMTFAGRHAVLARQLAAEEQNAERKQELRDIADRCSKVPAQPATTFAEALQAIYFTHISAQIEAGYESAFSLGRIDQFLLPYYEKDKRAGHVTPESAQELLECLYIKLSHVIPLFDSDVSLAFSGLTTFANAVVGGVDAQGKDATNELSLIVIRAMNHMRTPNPTLGARIHRDTPPQFLRIVCEALIEGMGNLQFLNDESIIGALRQRGVPLKDARGYGIIGCVEPAVPGRSFTSSDAALFNLALPLELALNDGYAHIFHENLGLRTGDPRRFTSMTEVLEAYTKQTKHLVGLMAQGLNGLAQANAELKPTPFTSAITERCLETGKDVTGGGAIYNFTGVQGVGLASVADSLAAIDQLLYRDQSVTWDALLKALSNDFRDSEPARQIMLNRAPKYGNDEELVDKYAAFVAQLYSDEVSRHATFRGGTLLPGLYSVATHIAFGVMVGALPSGRRAGTPLSCGVTPAPGAAQKGPTAALRSVAKLNHRLIANGSALNLRLSPTHLKGKHGAQLLSSLVTTFFGLGGMQIQFNLVDSQTLRRAQEHPEEYRDLVVRVAGYSALFTDLDRLVQDELIARTEFQTT